MRNAIDLSEEQLQFIELARQKSINERTIVFVHAVVSMTWDSKAIHLFGLQVSNQDNVASCIAVFNRGERM